MDLQNDSNRKWDLLGTLISGAALVAGSLISFVGCRFLAASREMFAEIGDVELPVISKYAMIVQNAHGFDIAALLLLALGIVLLIIIKDRPRANLYAGLTALLLGLGGGGLLVVAAFPLIKLVTTMGTQN